MAPPIEKKLKSIIGDIPQQQYGERKTIVRKSTRVRHSVYGSVDDFEEWKRARMLLKPPDQLQLTDTELKEEIARVLNSTNPQIGQGLVEFNYAQGQFIPVPHPGNTVILINIRGIQLHKDSEEGKKQIILMGDDYVEEIEEEEIEEEEGKEATSIGSGEEEEEGDEDEELEGEGEEGEEQMPGEKGDEEDEAPVTTGKKKKLTNQFNFCERAALTYNNAIRSHETQTIPPPKADFGGLVLQWIIYDAYDADYTAQQKEKEKEKKVLFTKKVTVKKKKRGKTISAVQQRMFIAWKTLERMVNLNTFDDVAKDFRYYEDPSDEYRGGEGTLLPLWKFNYEKTKKSMVTDIAWNPWYYDLFIVAFGTLNYRKFAQGAVCMFTLKNPSFPEHICLTDSEALSIDIHPKYPFMVVVGLFNGSVYVYNVTLNCKEPQFKSNSTENKHSGMVWKVKWGPDLQDGEMNFYSIGTDGKVNNWVLMQNDLAISTIITLYLEKDPVPGPDGTILKLKACATCMIFHPTNPLVFLVGTEEGLIYKCSTLYSATYLFTYHAHTMPVYSLDYNKFQYNVFLSTSADWRIKIWEDNRPEPLFVFDLGAAIGCGQWAPYSSTVFAVCTERGRVYVFDLNVNKYKSICKQNIVSRKKYSLTRLTFNTKVPIIIVGDDTGTIHTLKLSPNLRLPIKVLKKQMHLDHFTLQVMKLDKILSLVREPPVLTPPEDVETDD